MANRSAHAAAAPAVTGCLRRYLLAALLLRVADEGARVGLVLLAVGRGSGPGFGAAMITALLVPHVLAAPAVGLATDRAAHPTRVLALAGTGFAAALTTAAHLTGRSGPVPVLTVLVLGGCCGPAMTGALSSQLPGLVAPGAAARAFGLDSLTYNLAGIAGPLLATLVATTAGPGAATASLAGSAMLGALTLLTLRVRTQRHASANLHPPAPAPPLTAGLRAITGNPALRLVTATTGLGQLGPGALPVVAVVLADQTGHPATAGWLLSAVAAGALLGSLAWTARPAVPEHAVRVVLAGLAGLGAPLAAGALVPGNLAVLVILFTASGIALGPLTGALFLARNEHAPTGLHAQVFTIGAGVKTTATAVGAALAGTVTGLPSSVQLALVGAAPLLAAAVGAAAHRNWSPTGGDPPPKASVRKAASTPGET